MDKPYHVLWYSRTYTYKTLRGALNKFNAIRAQGELVAVFDHTREKIGGIYPMITHSNPNARLQ